MWLLATEMDDKGNERQIKKMIKINQEIFKEW